MKEKEKERNANQHTHTHRERERERERELGNFSTRFDTTTSSFPALLVTKSYRKRKCKVQKKSFHTSQWKNCSKTFFDSGLLSCNHSARLKKLRWPVMIVKLRKAQKHSKISKTTANFNKILLKFVILLSSEHHSIFSRDYAVSLFQDLNSFAGPRRSIHLEHDNFSKTFNWILSKNC